jgi:hypothetical protein
MLDSSPTTRINIMPIGSVTSSSASSFVSSLSPDEPSQKKTTPITTRLSSESYVIEIPSTPVNPPPYQAEDPNPSSSSSSSSNFYDGLREAFSRITSIKTIAVGTMLLTGGYTLGALARGDSTGLSTVSQGGLQAATPLQMGPADPTMAGVLRCLKDHALNPVPCLKELFKEPGYKYSEADLGLWHRLQLDQKQVTAEVDWNTLSLGNGSSSGSGSITTHPRIDQQTLERLQSLDTQWRLEAEGFDPEIFHRARTSQIWPEHGKPTAYVMFDLTEKGAALGVDQLHDILGKLIFKLQIK